MISYCFFHPILLLLPTSIESSLDTDNSWDSIRFSEAKYLTTNLETLLVQGAVKLNFKVNSESDFIVFHSKNMSITGPKINDGVGLKWMSDSNKRDQVLNMSLF